MNPEPGTVEAFLQNLYDFIMNSASFLIAYIDSLFT